MLKYKQKNEFETYSNFEINFKKIYEHSSIGTAFVSLEGKWIDVNIAVCKILGYSKEEMLESDFLSITHPDDLELDLGLVKKLLNNELQSCEMQKRYYHKEGHLVWALLNVSLMKDSEGTPLYFISHIQDITNWKQKESELKEALENKNLLNDQLRNAYEETESLIRERTKDFEDAIEALRVEIDNRKKYQKELEESEKRFLDLYDNAPDMYISVDTKTAKIIQCNKTLAHNTGYSKEEIIDRSIFNIYHPDCHLDVSETFADFKKNGIIKDKELQLRTKDGKRIDISLNASAVRDEEGNIIRSRSNLRDISQQKKLESKLHDTINKLSRKGSFEQIIRIISQSVHNSLDPDSVLENTVQSLIDNISGLASACVYLVDGEYASLKAQKGLPKQYLDKASRIPRPVGFTWKTIFENAPIYCPDIDKDEVIGPAGRELGARSYISMPINIHGATIGALILHSYNLDGFDKDHLNMLNIVTQQIEVAFSNARKAEALSKSELELKNLNEDLESKIKERTKELTHYTEELKNSNRELEQFAYVASHDLQEPLRKIKNFTELFASRYKDNIDEKANRYIDFIVDGSTRMQKLISDLLEYSRVGRQEKEVRALDLNQVVGKTISTLEMNINNNDARVEYKNLPMALMNENDLYRIFINLISNAIKFRKPDSKPVIKIDCKTENGMNIIRVSDNGIGIEDKHISKVFGIFERVHTKAEYPGTGIGLAICKKIVETYGGAIWLESEPGEGTDFYFSIPIPDAEKEEITNVI